MMNSKGPVLINFILF